MAYTFDYAAIKTALVRKIDELGNGRGEVGRKAVAREINEKFDGDGMTHWTVYRFLRAREKGYGISTHTLHVLIEYLGFDRDRVLDAAPAAAAS